jgi:hypothetical protein
MTVNNGCSSQELIDTVSSMKFFRKNNGTLDFYDANLTLRIEFFYAKELASNFNSSVILSNNSPFLSTLQKVGVIGKW